MYRDEDNFKTTQEVALSVEGTLNDNEVMEFLKNEMPQEDILAADYGLPNIAAGDSPADLYAGPDHCFMEISDFSLCHSEPSDDVKQADITFEQLVENVDAKFGRGMAP